MALNMAKLLTQSACSNKMEVQKRSIFQAPDPWVKVDLVLVRKDQGRLDGYEENV